MVGASLDFSCVLHKQKSGWLRNFVRVYVKPLEKTKDSENPIIEYFLRRLLI